MTTAATNMTTASPVLAGEAVTIRPIHPADSVMESEFVQNLSIETKHYRFFGGVKELSATELKRLCGVDGVHSMAFVATVQRDGHETEIGVSRYSELASDGAGEMAVTIADTWQDKGLGELLLQRLFAYAKSHGVKRLYSVELADNSAMRKLAGELGMRVTGDPDDPNQVIYSLSL
jgi:RimJ/RimL family protein N-acetyltransferase